MYVSNFISGSSAFLNPAWTCGNSLFTYYWSLAWRILNITLLACEMSVSVWYFDHSLTLPFFEIGMKTDLFWFCGYCWVFQISWHIEWSTFTVSSLWIWNSSTGIPSPPLALFTVMLPKAHLISHSRMSGSRWVITPSWLSGSWRSFLYISSVYSCHLVLISPASVRSIPGMCSMPPQSDFGPDSGILVCLHCTLSHGGLSTNGIKCMLRWGKSVCWTLNSVTREKKLNG